MDTQSIPADVAEQLATERDFEDAAGQAYEITWAILEQRRAELAEAQEALERANDAWEAAARANDLAQKRVSDVRKANGIVTGADGDRLADRCPACGGWIDAGRHLWATDALNCDWSR